MQIRESEDNLSCKDLKMGPWPQILSTQKYLRQWQIQRVFNVMLSSCVWVAVENFFFKFQFLKAFIQFAVYDQMITL